MAPWSITGAGGAGCSRGAGGANCGLDCVSSAEAVEATIPASKLISVSTPLSTDGDSLFAEEEISGISFP